MVAQGPLTMLVSFFSITMTVCLHLTGVMTCKQIITKRSVGSLTHLPFVSAALMSGLWTSYGVLVADSSVTFVNIIGAVLQTTYFCIYYKYSESGTDLFRDGGIAITLFLSAFIYFFFIGPSKHHDSEDIHDNTNIFALGIVCNIFTILFFASPLAKMSEVIRTKDTSSMSFPLSVMSSLVSSSWLFYGILVKDIFIQLPNFIGLILAICQLSLFILYPKRTGNVSRSASPIGLLPI